MYGIGEIELVVNKGDYQDDLGLWNCGKCHTRKQTRYESKSGKIKIFTNCLCKCEIENLESQETKKRQEEERRRIDNNRQFGFSSVELRNMTFEKDDCARPQLTAIAKRYAENFKTIKNMDEKKKGLLLCGTVGTGKTFIASCIANKVIDDGFSARVTNFTEILSAIQSNFSQEQEIINDLKRYDLLVIDDLSAERSTEFSNEKVYNVIDGRYLAGKPTIITTNLTKSELLETFDISKGRIYSRLLEMCKPIVVDGNDRRKVNKSTSLDKLLGG